MLRLAQQEGEETMALFGDMVAFGAVVAVWRVYLEAAGWVLHRKVRR